MLEVVALLDDDETKIGSKLRGIPVVGKTKDISILDIDYDEIYISTPSATTAQMREIINFFVGLLTNHLKLFLQYLN